MNTGKGKQMKISQDGYDCKGTVAFPDKYSGDDCCCCTRHCLRHSRCTIGQCADMGIDIGQEELDAEFSQGPRVHNAIYTRCSKKYATRAWAQIACLNDAGCEWIQDYNCDDRAWRYCGKIEDQFSGDEGGCSLNKKWLPGIKAGNDLYRTKCSNAQYGSLAWAQTKCEADPKCEWIHDFNGDGNAWRFCGNKAQIEPGDEKADTMMKTMGDGLIRLKDPRYAGAALSVEAGGNRDGGKVWMWSITRDEWQTWEFRADGTIRLAKYPEYALSMQEGGCRNQGGVHMAKIGSGSLSQNVVWKVYEDGTIRPRAFDQCPLAIQANQHRDRGRVWMWGSVNKDVWQTWGGLPKAIPKGPPIKKTRRAPPDEDEDEESPKDSEQEDEEDPKVKRLYDTWKATGCPNTPSSSWGGWAWYLKQKDSTVLYDIYQWCVLTSKKHRAQCCAGKRCKPKCVKQKKWPGSSLLDLDFTEDDSEKASFMAVNSTDALRLGTQSTIHVYDADDHNKRVYGQPKKDHLYEKTAFMMANSTESLGPEAQSAVESQIIDV